MKCERCGALIRTGEEMQYTGRTICEDCYMDIPSPSRACDPWAVYTAKSFPGSDPVLTENQAKILQVLEETGGIEPARLAERLNMSLRDLGERIRNAAAYGECTGTDAQRKKDFMPFLIIEN
jgi:hypothetical protein